MGDKGSRIIALTLSPELYATHSMQRHDQEKAVADFIQHNYVELDEGLGPFTAAVTLRDQKMWIIIKGSTGDTVVEVKILLSGLKRMMKDYTIICENYQQAVATSDPSKVQAIDMGRRSLHNEGAELIEKMIKPAVTVDFETARRLFSLLVTICR